VGIAQWLVLRHKLTGAFWWILATAGGGLIGVGTFYTLPGIDPSSNSSLEQSIFLIGIVIEILGSLVTGCTMLWLLKRNANRKAVLW